MKRNLLLFFVMLFLRGTSFASYDFAGQLACSGKTSLFGGMNITTFVDKEGLVSRRLLDFASDEEEELVFALDNLSKECSAAASPVASLKKEKEVSPHASFSQEKNPALLPFEFTQKEHEVGSPTGSLGKKLAASLSIAAAELERTEKQKKVRIRSASCPKDVTPTVGFNPLPAAGIAQAVKKRSLSELSDSTN